MFCRARRLASNVDRLGCLDVPSTNEFRSFNATANTKCMCWVLCVSCEGAQRGYHEVIHSRQGEIVRGAWAIIFAGNTNVDVHLTFAAPVALDF